MLDEWVDTTFLELSEAACVGQIFAAFGEGVGGDTV